MVNPRLVVGAFWVVGIGCLTVAALEWSRPLRRGGHDTAAGGLLVGAVVSGEVVVEPGQQALVAAEREFRDGNPFRVDRRPSLVPYSLISAATELVEAPTVDRSLPGLRLAGVVGGPPWNALFLGIPGKETGIVLELGDAWNGFRFETIRADSVLLSGLDTTWAFPISAR